MTNYIITGAAPTLYVEQDRGVNGIFRNGPYKNEESAKRRIRKLKKDEAPQHIADGDIGGTLRTADAANDPQARDDVKCITCNDDDRACKCLNDDPLYDNIGLPLSLSHDAFDGIAEHHDEDGWLAAAYMEIDARNARPPQGEYGKFAANLVAAKLDYPKTDDIGFPAFVRWAGELLNAGKPRNGYRPAHRANNLRGMRRVAASNVKRHASR